MKVAIVVMPFQAVDRPSLAAGLLKAGVEKRGIACDCKYFNLTFAKMTGKRIYEDILDKPATVLAGEWVFSQFYYGQSFSDWSSYESEILGCSIWGMGEDGRQDIRTALDLAPAFLRVVFESNDWGQYDLVAFTSTFEQTMPSLCLAKMIRERYPRVRLAAGGANFESSMGLAYMEHFLFLDYVCTGEGDNCFPELCENLSRGIEEVPPGMLYRAGDQVVSTPKSNGGFVEMDLLPTPGFDEYFRVLSACFPGPEIEPSLPIETSRGCWWGERSHCTFCGLNGEGIKFRRKDWHRVVEEVDELTSLYPTSPVQFTDNILSMDHFKNLLPYWANKGDSTPKFFEVKSNLNRDQVEMLRWAGVTSIQPGIENFADDTLRLMRKGVSGAQNVAILRWSAELDLRVLWNLIFGFPREQVTDYETNLAVMKLLTHLRPPDVCAYIRLDRFSPNFTEWRSLGFSTIRPLAAYKHIFPFEETELCRLAYYFAYEHENLDRALHWTRALEDFGDCWRDKSRAGENGSLAVRPRFGGGYVLVDTRFNFESSKLVLSPLELNLLLQCDSPIGPRRAVMNAATECELTAEHAQQVFDTLISRGVIAVIGKQAITLALLPPEARHALDTELRKSPSRRSEDQWQLLNIL
jgi:ribosomal peptide maturation radical SAM protein 1